MAILIPAAGETREVQPADGVTFTIHELQGFVGGYIEAVRVGDDYLFLNEEGKLKQLPVNRAATVLTLGLIAADDYIVGDCVLCSPLEAGEGDP